MIPQPWEDRLLNLALSPALWLSILLAVVYSTLFTIWRGGGFKQWLFDLLAGLIGFGLGQLAGSLFRSTLVRVGDVHLLWGSLGAVIALWLGRQLRPSAAPFARS
jgi:uncharacterized membrane protein YeaQ/YmgE (transglycosylase-associated protein family)